MRLFGDTKVLRGSIAWTNPLRLKVTVLPPAVPVQVEKPDAQAAPLPLPVPIEYDEDGRQWVFRFARTAPQRYVVDRDRLFEYMKKHRLPNETARQIRRDLRNSADFITDVRDLQTHYDVEQVSKAPKATVAPLRRASALRTSVLDPS